MHKALLFHDTNLLSAVDNLTLMDLKRLSKSLRILSFDLSLYHEYIPQKDLDEK